MSTTMSTGATAQCACPSCRTARNAAGDADDEIWRRRRLPPVRWQHRRPTRRICPPGSIAGPFGVCLRSPIVLPQDALPPPLPDGTAPEPAPVAAGGGCGPVGYAIDAAAPYGPRWGRRRPPGLPASARRTSVAGAARGPIVCLARARRLGTTFVNTVLSLADNETGGSFRFALPANAFNALPAEQRGGAALITAWGVFQFNRAAWARDVGRLLGRPSSAMPWQCTPREEIEYPVRFYALVFRQIRAAGGSPLDAARGVRLQHHGPGYFNRFLATGRRRGFTAAWNEVDPGQRRRIDRSLAKWRIPGDAPVGV